MAELDFNKLELIKNKEYFNMHHHIITCKVCLGFVVNPQECTECHTSFCKDCITKCDKCPVRCKGKHFVKPNRSTLSIFENLIIICERCSKLLKYSQLVDHIENQCEKIIIKCTNPGCTEKIAKDNFADHLLNCESGVTECEECGHSTIRKNLKKIIDYNRKSICEKITEITKYSREIDILTENNESLQNENENLKVEISSIKESKEILQKENENLRVEVSSM
jgi:hypothetical protein